MKKTILLSVLLVFGLLKIAQATPYINNGMRMGPIKADISFWGEIDTENGKEYFDGITYSNKTQIKVPSKKVLIDVNIQRSDQQSASKKWQTRNFSFKLSKPIDGFNGKIEIHILNPDGTKITQQYVGTGNNPATYPSYEEMNLTGAKAKAKISVDLLLDNGKRVVIPVKDTISWQWGLIAELPVAIGKPALNDL